VFCKPTYYPNGIKIGGCFEVDPDTDLSALFKKQNFAANGTIAADTNLAVSTGTNTLVMPLLPTKGILEIKSISGVITLDPGTNTVENGNSISTAVARRFNLDGTVWIEL